MAQFSELFKAAQAKELEKMLPAIKGMDQGARDTYVEDYATSLETLKQMMDPRKNYRGPRVNMSEALKSADVSILFPRVISDILMRPIEPIMIGQTLLAKTVQIDNTRSVEFPTLGAIRAFDMGETQEYREQLLDFGEELTEVKVNKVGAMVSISDQLVEDSMWDVVALHIEALGYAMIRHKEEKIFNEFRQKAHVVFDNSLSTPSAWTHGYDVTQHRNYTVTYDDILDTMGALVNNEYIPTDIIMHPLAWVVFAKDPILRNLMFTQSSIGQSVWTYKPDFDQQTNVPWNISYQISPFVNFQFNSVLTSGPATGLSQENISDIYVVDRQNALVVLQRSAMEMDQFDDPRRDITSAKVRERYGVGALNGGRAAAMIKNVRLAQNFAPAYAVTNVGPPSA